MSYQWLRGIQDSDTKLKKQCQDSKLRFHTRLFNEIELVCCNEPGNDLTDYAVDQAISWCHQMFNHPGQQRLLQGMARYFHPKLKQKIDAFKCDAYQRYKPDGHGYGYGHLPARDVRTAPWEQVDVDLIGHWKVQTGTNRVYEFSALMSIDRVTGPAEMIRIEDKTSHHVSETFAESWWLSRYSHPFSCCHDNGGEFTGWEFQAQLSDFGIRDVPTMSRNPASNGICERMHGTVGNFCVRRCIHIHQERLAMQKLWLMKRWLQLLMEYVRMCHSTGYSPGALALHRDMLLDVPLVADLRAVR